MKKLRILKKGLALLLTVAMVFGLMPGIGTVSVSAADSDVGTVTFTSIEGTAGYFESTSYDKLFDGMAGTEWYIFPFRKATTDSSGKITNGAYVIFEASEAICVDGYSIRTGSYTRNPGCNPKSWTLYGCNNLDECGESDDKRNFTGWEKIHTVENDTVLQGVNFTEYDFHIEKDTLVDCSYKYFKLEIAENSGISYMRMGKFTLNYPTHTHEWSKTSEIEQTCVEPGYNVYACTYPGCDEERVVVDESRPAGAEYHGTITNYPVKDPTCCKAGNYEYWTCSHESGVSYKDAELSEKYDVNEHMIPALGHLDEDGNYICDRCGDEMATFTALATDGDVDGSLLLDGLTTTRWGKERFANGTGAYVIFKASEPILVNGYKIWPPIGVVSNYNNWLATPTEWTLYACNDYDEASASGGTWVAIHNVSLTSSDWREGDTSAKEFTIGESYNIKTGYQYFKLKITKNVGTTSPDPMYMSEFALTYMECEHDWQKTTETIDPTCTEPGYDVYKCVECSGRKFVENDNGAMGHDWFDTIVAPTCTEDGYILYECSRCHETYTEDNNTPATGHTWINPVVIDPTCTEEGYTHVECENCDAEDDQDFVPYLGHDFNEDGMCTRTDCGTLITAELSKPSGEGTEQNPYKISTPGELYWFAGLVNGDADVCKDGVSQNQGACAKLVANITVNSNLLSSVENDVEESAFRSWTPIGSASYPFRGCFDGTGHTISGLYVNASEQDYVGFFGNITTRAGSGNVIVADGRPESPITISNLAIEDSYFCGNDYVGGLCGMNGIKCNESAIRYATSDFATVWGADIESCSFEGTVRGNGYIGGLIGGSASDVTSCHSTGSVTGNKCVGGLLGWHAGDVTLCYNTASVTSNGGTGSYVGGLLGWYVGNMTSCYNTGSVTCSGTAPYVGGLIGGTDYSASYHQYFTAINIQKCYNTGNVTANSTEGKGYIGGIVGSVIKQKIVLQYCYNAGDVDVSSDNDYVGGIAGSARIVRDCYNVGTITCAGYAGGCFGIPAPSGEVERFYNAGFITGCTSGAIIGTKSDGGRYLYVNNYNYYREGTCNTSNDATSLTDEKLCGATLPDGFDSNVWSTGSYSCDMNGKEKNVNLTFPSLKDVGTATTKNTTKYNFGIDGEDNYQEYFTISEPEDLLKLKYSPYCNYVLMNDIDMSGVEYAAGNDFSGMFDGNGHTISNLSGPLVKKNSGLIMNVDMMNSNLGSVASGTVCETNNGTIMNCHITDTAWGFIEAATTANKYLGGICAYNYGTIRECSFDGDVDAVFDIIVTMSFASYVGGICGYNGADAVISNCYYVGDIETVMIENPGNSMIGYAGGICAYNDGSLSSSFCIAKIQSSLCSGGLVGGTLGTVTNCYYNSDSCDLGWKYNRIHDTAKEKSSMQFMSGEVAYLLSQGNDGENMVWGQTVSGDNRQSHPVLGGERVYKVEVTTSCATENNVADMYSNENIGSISAQHCYTKYNKLANATCTYGIQYVEVCAVCGAQNGSYLYIGDPLGHGTVTKYDAKAPTCTEAGNHTYWMCSREPDVFYKDAELSIPYADSGEVTIAPLGHLDANRDDICERCDALFSDKTLRQPEGEGTYSSPYLIKTPGELYWFAGLVNNNPEVCKGDVVQNTLAYARLEDDIIVNYELSKTLEFDEAGNVTNSDMFVEWTPIGNADNPYIGTLFGNNHTISGLYFNDSEKDYAGLFGKIGSAERGGRVENLTVADSYIKGKDYVGGIAGESTGDSDTSAYSKIVNCVNKGEIIGASYVGGISGATTCTTIEKCYNTGNITGTTRSIGGLIGCVYTYSGLTKCYNTGDVYLKSDLTTGSAYVGGLCGSYGYGYNTNDYISYSYNVGNVTGISESDVKISAGGLVGYAGKNVSYCINFGNVSTKGEKAYAGGLFGYGGMELLAESCLNVGYVVSNPRKTDTYTGKALSDAVCPDFYMSSNGSLYSAGVENGYYKEGCCEFVSDYDTMYNYIHISPLSIQDICGDSLMSGFDSSEFNIGSYEETQINDKLKKLTITYPSFVDVGTPVSTEVMMCNFGTDAEPVWEECDVIWTAADFVAISENPTKNYVLMADIDMSGVAYTPISTGQYNSFSGKFEGNGHTISNLNITDETGSCVGVFGYNTGLIRNLGVINANISGSGVAGGLCAYNDGTILNCYFTGTVSSIGTYVGGLCGQNRTGKIGNCYFNGSVSLSNTTSSYRYLGGLCGYNSNGNIWNCYCVATVSGEAEYKGAFAGDGSNNPPIYVGNCYYDNSVCSLPGLGRFDFGGVVTGKNFSSFAMGEVAFLLSQDTTIDGTVYEASNWGQVLTGDNRQDYPVLNGADVYKVTVTAACKENTGYMYSNTNEPIVSDHCYSCAKKTADATCTIPEQWSRYCSLCLEVSSNTEDTIPFGEPLGHCDILKHDANAPTCTEDGNPEYWTCSREDGVYYKDESLSETYNIDDIVLAATGHADNDDDGVCDNCPEVLNAYKHLQTLITSVKAIRPGDYSDASYQALQTALAEVEVLTDASTDEELATAYEILAAAKDGLKTIKTIVTTSCVPSNLSDLTGDGKYAVGETITLTAKAVSGYKFIGWYVAGSDTALSTDITYEVTVTEETAAELNYMAKYEANESKKMSVTVGNGTVAYRYQNGAESGIWSNSFTDNTFTEGTYFTVIAQPDAGHTFLYWIDSEGRILTESETYSFYLGDDLKLEARYKKAVDNKHYVIFKDMNGKILWTGDVSMNQSDDDWATSYGTVALPSHGMFTGYTFSRWSDASGNVISTDETGNIKITEDIVIRAEYVPKAGLTLTINGSLQDTTYAYASNVTVTADNSKDGKYFSGWYIGDNRVSDSLEYTFYITENTSLTAKYEGDDVIVQQPFVNMAISERTTLENGNQTMVMNVTWSVPEGYTFVEGGIVRSLKEEYSDKLTLTDVDGTNVKKNVSKIAVAEGTYVYTLTLGASSIGKNVYAVGYIICRNEATGEVLTIYTDRCTSNAVSGN